MPSTLHEGLIVAAAARFPGMRIGKFAEEVRVAVAAHLDAREANCEGHSDDNNLDYVREMLGPFRRPDAHVINREDCEVIAIEVDVGGPLNDDKLRDYAELWFQLDHEMWLLRLVCVDRYGRDTEIDLCSWWFQYSGDRLASPGEVDAAQIAMRYLRAPAFDARQRYTDEQQQAISDEWHAARFRAMGLDE